jgi:hypothetical protein
LYGCRTRGGRNFEVSREGARRVDGCRHMEVRVEKGEGF